MAVSQIVRALFSQQLDGDHRLRGEPPIRPSKGWLFDTERTIQGRFSLTIKWPELADLRHPIKQNSRPKAAVAVDPENRPYLTIWFSSPLA